MYAVPGHERWFPLQVRGGSSYSLVVGRQRVPSVRPSSMVESITVGQGTGTSANASSSWDMESLGAFVRWLHPGRQSLIAN